MRSARATSGRKPRLMGRRPVRNFSPTAARRARERLGLSQEDVADALGISRTNYVLVEAGRRGMGPAVLRRLAQILKVEPYKLTTTSKSQATLRDLREWAGLTQAEVAQLLGVATTTYATIERGERQPTDDALLVLGLAFDCKQPVARRAWAHSSSPAEVT
jgi:transcriptional regulator with XRE-family HTH domain